MELGAFSLSLNVKDIIVSKEFYEKLGFEFFGGDISQNWLIMRNEKHVIGLFQEMLDNNIMTFNPGWDQEGNNLKNYTDIRDIQKSLRSKGIKFEEEADESHKGPTSLIIKDPDGNAILLDQHR